MLGLARGLPLSEHRCIGLGQRPGSRAENFSMQPRVHRKSPMFMRGFCRGIYRREDPGHTAPATRLSPRETAPLLKGYLVRRSPSRASASRFVCSRVQGCCAFAMSAVGATPCRSGADHRVDLEPSAPPCLVQSGPNWVFGNVNLDSVRAGRPPSADQ